jgi:hypothetical protein
MSSMFYIASTISKEFTLLQPCLDGIKAKFDILKMYDVIGFKTVLLSCILQYWFGTLYSHLFKSRLGLFVKLHASLFIFTL